MSFATAIWGLTNEMDSAGVAEEFISLVNSTVFWEAISEKSKILSQEFGEMLVFALISSGDVEACYLYCRHIEDRTEVRQILIDSSNAEACCKYCLNVRDCHEVRQAMITSRDDNTYYWYLHYVKEQSSVEEVFAEKG